MCGCDVEEIVPEKSTDPGEEVEGEKYFRGDLGFRRPRRFTMPGTLDNDRLTDWRL